MSHSGKLLMTLLTRNEEDILPHFLRFHRAQGVDHFIVTDNLSTDSTIAILRDYEEMGWLTLLEEHSDDYDQEAWVTKMARIAAEPCYSANWIIHSDADEFWVSQSGCLRDYFSSVDPKFNIVSAKRHNFIAVRGGPELWYDNMVHRCAISLNYRGKLLPDKIAHRPCLDVTVAQGNHSVSGIANPLIYHDGIEILHFPVRSLRQVEQKIRFGGAAYARNTRQSADVGLGWRRLYDQLITTGTLQPYFEDNSIDPCEVAGAIDRGDLIFDDRVRRYLVSFV